MKIQVKFTDEELLEVLHSALCNGGLVLLANCGVRVLTNNESLSYKRAKDRISNESRSICYEDVLVEILRGGDELSFYDYEDNERLSFGLAQARENLEKEEFADDLMTIHNEQDDAITGYNVIQGALYGEVIYC
jgi:hypothetical protein